MGGRVFFFFFGKEEGCGFFLGRAVWFIGCWFGWGHLLLYFVSGFFCVRVVWLCRSAVCSVFCSGQEVEPLCG